MLGYTTPYEKLNSTENVSIEDPHIQTRPYSRRPSIATCLLALTTVLFGAQSLYLWSRPAPTCSRYPFDAGYPTEWGPAVESIKLEKTTFTSPLRYNTTSSQLYRDFDASQPQYIGAPSPEIDAAWESLLGGQFLVLSDDEATELDDPVSIEGRWVGEVEVMHSLHCLNTLRKALSPEYYGGASHLGPAHARSRLSVHLGPAESSVRGRSDARRAEAVGGRLAGRGRGDPDGAYVSELGGVEDVVYPAGGETWEGGLGGVLSPTESKLFLGVWGETKT
ncbi:oxidase ustYa family protein [Aspergillus clavatus NRRL 1]|uniref:Uncharacterized protein n=1 Tax=Aspergillus clavatus (strain ATCC 1007 / CBS 513.65 / DSM 816 / NCTC 3887 / NRRL 1 / QM 1276 / 107) TaxID=344612 RepID=A1CLT6_ASPCL|nr:uncharacterized protein ACLA_078130 [Aspergillus clavatus NRRL 1]EAW09065.1 hypothetical protein ACLA_078130 [Aspergillus clavatus NRRL 1]